MKYGTLLVIDDNPSILTALKICLGNTFERILTLSRPETAPTLLQQEQVDLILLDMNFSLGVNSGQDGLLWLVRMSVRRVLPRRITGLRLRNMLTAAA